MAASMWRMNGLCRSMTGVLLLCALLFSSKVICEVIDDPNNGTDGSAGGANVTAAPQTTVFHSVQASGGSAASATASAAVTMKLSNDKEEPSLGNNSATLSYETTQNVSPNKSLQAAIECVGEGEIPEQSAVKVEVTKTTDCEGTKRIIMENLAHWCSSEKCNLKIFQKDNNILMTSNDTKLSSLAGALQSEMLKDKLGLTNVEIHPLSSSVFVGILVTGLLAALGIIVGYIKCQRRPDAKGAKLAEEAYPVDQENQGNTLASEAPLNPPPETQEKPSINGESLEAVKTETSPPTNGHSTAKTADTEL